MRNILLSLLLLLAFVADAIAQGYRPQTGDILFQTSQSEQSRAIQIATKSPYSHVGVVFIRDDKPFVLEAIEPVQFTPMNIWIKQGVNSSYVAKRLIESDSILTKDNLAELLAVGKSFVGRHYDDQYQWTDSSMYCSELVWKLYREALGIEIGALTKLKSFDLADSIVSAKLKERYGTNIPYEEPVVAPVTIFDSKLLTTVYQSK